MLSEMCGLDCRFLCVRVHRVNHVVTIDQLSISVYRKMKITQVKFELNHEL